MANPTLKRYRHLRAISTQFQTEALRFIASGAIMEYAKRLGILHGTTVVADNQEIMTLAFDLALHTAKPGRSRALDRYARTMQLSPDSDEGRVLAALCQSRFSIWRIVRRHADAGLILEDTFRSTELWLMDENLTTSASLNSAIALRICQPDEFAMSCGVIVPVTLEVVERAMTSFVGGRNNHPAQDAQDPRFAIALYRSAIEAGVMNTVQHR